MNLPRQVKNQLLCVGLPRGSRQEVAATGSPGTEKTAPLETPEIPAQHKQRHGQQCLSLQAFCSLSKKPKPAIAIGSFF